MIASGILILGGGVRALEPQGGGSYIAEPGQRGCQVAELVQLVLRIL